MKTFATFEELGKAFGLAKRPRKQKPFICKKCGGEMYHIPMTNIFICENETGEDNNGKPKVCGHRVFTARAF